MKLSDIYLFSDFDGTVCSYTQGIPERNIEAINRFVQKGGHFSLATGRSPRSAKPFLERLAVNAPCLCLNGGAAYDMKTDQYLFANYLPKQAQTYTQELLQKYPHWDVAVVTMEGYYYVSDPDLSIGRMNRNDYFLNPRFEKPIDEDWFKVVFNTPQGDAKVFIDSLKPEDFPGVTFTTSDTYFVEMLPQGTSKGAAILAICKELGLEIGQTVAIGDYYNDVEMLRTAGFSACVAGAPQELHNMVDMVLCSAEDGAVAQLIEYLESQYDV